MKIIIALVFVTLTLYSNLHAQSNKDATENKIDTIFKRYLSTKGPGCAVGIVRDGKVIFKKGYGLSNLEYNIPVTSHSIFDIASLSKEFTGLAISILIQQGKLALDDDIHKYLPEVPDFGKPITIKNLLHHTSGLRDWPEALNAGGWSYEEEASFDDIMRMVKQQKELDFEPGTEYQYSNTGYNMLAAIIEKVTGKTFKQYTDSAIFMPLGMLSSHFLDNKGTIIPDLAYSYSEQDNRYLKIQNVLTAYGSSSLYTSVDDLTKWMINFQQQLSIKNPIYTRMTEESLLNNGKKNVYGFGLSTGSDRGLKTISHTGGWAGYNTIIKFYPEEKLSIIILSNASDGKVYDEYIKGIADVFLKDKFKKDNNIDYSKINVVKTDTSLLKKYAGNYKWDHGAVDITLKDGQIMFQYTGEDAFPTKALSDTSFYLTVAGLPVTFSKPVNGAASSFTFRNITGTRFTPYVPSVSDLNEYVGTYYSEELEAQYKVSVKNGKLMLHNFRLGDFELNTFIKDEFRVDIGTLLFFRDANNKPAGFTYSGGRVRNIRFDKK